MEQVSSFLSSFDNIITVQPSTAESDDSYSQSKRVSDSHVNQKKSNNAQKRYSQGMIPDLDFSSMFNSKSTPSINTPNPNRETDLSNPVSNMSSSLPSSTDFKKTKRNSSSFIAAPTSSQLTDKLFEKIISMALPTSTSTIINKNYVNDRVIMQKQRPALSVQTMSRNVIQLNQRLSSPFELIDEIIKIFSWTRPTYTVGILLLYTHLVLNPYLFYSIPFFYICFIVMVPNYSVRHLPETSEFLDHNPIPADGPPLNDIDLPKPVPELSREFILNLTDLQNHVMIYIVVYDFLTSVFSEFGYWTNESFSSFFYLISLAIGCINFFILPYFIHYIPIKIILISAGWASLVCFHPNHRNQILTFIYSEETRLRLLSVSNQLEEKIKDNFEFYDPQEQRQVEIFELQKLNSETKQWELINYTKDFYSINSNQRESNNLPPGTSSLSYIKPPVDWEFIQDKWKLDLDSSTWVSENFISDLVNIDSDEKWVYDLTTDDGYHYSYKNGKNAEHEDGEDNDIDINEDNGNGSDNNEEDDSSTRRNSSGSGSFIDYVSGIYRRRRWIRICTRAYKIISTDDDAKSIKSNVSTDDLKKIDASTTANPGFAWS